MLKDTKNIYDVKLPCLVILSEELKMKSLIKQIICFDIIISLSMLMLGEYLIFGFNILSSYDWYLFFKGLVLKDSFALGEIFFIISLSAYFPILLSLIIRRSLKYNNSINTDTAQISNKDQPLTEISVDSYINSMVAENHLDKDMTEYAMSHINGMMANMPKNSNEGANYQNIDNEYEKAEAENELLSRNFDELDSADGETPVAEDMYSSVMGNSEVSENEEDDEDIETFEAEEETQDGEKKNVGSRSNMADASPVPNLNPVGRPRPLFNNDNQSSPFCLEPQEDILALMSKLGEFDHCNITGPLLVENRHLDGVPRYIDCLSTTYSDSEGFRMFGFLIWSIDEEVRLEEEKWVFHTKFNDEYKFLTKDNTPREYISKACACLTNIIKEQNIFDFKNRYPEVKQIEPVIIVTKGFFLIDEDTKATAANFRVPIISLNDASVNGDIPNPSTKNLPLGDRSNSFNQNDEEFLQFLSRYQITYG